MAWTDPPVKAVDDGITHTDWNTYVRDNLNALRVRPMCRVYRTTDQSIPNVTWTNVTFNAERYDTASMHSTVSNTDRITIPSGGDGVYEIIAHAVFALSTAPTRVIGLMKNGTLEIARSRYQLQISYSSRLHVATQVYLKAGDYVTCRVYQDNGSALALQYSGSQSPEFMAAWLGNPIV